MKGQQDNPDIFWCVLGMSAVQFDTLLTALEPQVFKKKKKKRPSILTFQITPFPLTLSESVGADIKDDCTYIVSEGLNHS